MDSTRRQHWQPWRRWWRLHARRKWLQARRRWRHTARRKRRWRSISGDHGDGGDPTGTTTDTNPTTPHYHYSNTTDTAHTAPHTRTHDHNYQPLHKHSDHAIQDPTLPLPGRLDYRTVQQPDLISLRHDPHLGRLRCSEPLLRSDAFRIC